MSWVLFSTFTGPRSVPGGAELFSPGSTRPFFIALMLFMLGYVVFLLLLFSEDIGEMFHKQKQ